MIITTTAFSQSRTEIIKKKINKLKNRLAIIKITSSSLCGNDRLVEYNTKTSMMKQGDEMWKKVC